MIWCRYKSVLCVLCVWLGALGVWKLIDVCVWAYRNVFVN